MPVVGGAHTVMHTLVILSETSFLVCGGNTSSPLGVHAGLFLFWDLRGLLGAWENIELLWNCLRISLFLLSPFSSLSSSPAFPNPCLGKVSGTWHVCQENDSCRRRKSLLCFLHSLRVLCSEPWGLCGLYVHWQGIGWLVPVVLECDQAQFLRYIYFYFLKIRLYPICLSVF